MKETLLKIFEDVKKQMIDEHHFMPIAIPISIDDEGDFVLLDPIPFMFDDDVEKIQLCFATGVQTRFNMGMALIIINQGFSKTWKNEEERKMIEENWDTERPSLYPESMRQNNVLITYIDFLEPNDNLMLISKFDEKKNGELFFDAPIFQEKTESFIIELISNGWHCMDSLFEDEDCDEDCENCENDCDEEDSEE